MRGFWRRVRRFGKRLLLLDHGVLIRDVLGNVVVFGHPMGKNKTTAQENHRDSRPMAEPALVRRLLILSHCNLLSIQLFDKNSLYGESQICQKHDLA